MLLLNPFVDLLICTATTDVNIFFVLVFLCLNSSHLNVWSQLMFDCSVPHFHEIPHLVLQPDENKSFLRIHLWRTGKYYIYINASLPNIINNRLYFYYKFCNFIFTFIMNELFPLIVKHVCTEVNKRYFINRIWLDLL